MVLPVIMAKFAASAAAKFGGAAAARTVVSRLATKVVPKVVARIPSRAAAKAALARVGIALPIKRTQPVAARPVTALKAAVATTAARFVEKPFRTALPYAATAGMLGAVSRLGEKKTEAIARRGGMVGEALTIPSAMPTGLGVGGIGRAMPRTVGEVPIMEPMVVRSWTTGTTDFAVDSAGKHWVLTKTGWKKYTPKKPIVLGTKHLTPKKFIAAAKKYYGLKKELDKVFKTVKKRK